MIKTNNISALRVRSGSVTIEDPFVSLIYTLLRDGHISAGSLEKIIRDEEEIFLKHNENGKLTMHYSNGWLACYAQDVTDRLKNMK